MTLFAGIVARGSAPHSIPEAAVRALYEGLSRRTGDVLESDLSTTHAFVWKDLGVFEGGAVRRTPGGPITLFAGEPLIDRPTGLHSRPHDLDDLHARWSAGDFSLLRHVRGAFCAVHFDPRTGSLWLVADKLALRPIYYAVYEHHVVFATSKRVLRANPLVDKRGDLRGLAETAAFGYPLGARSVLESVSSIEPSRIVEVAPDKVRISEYWRWDSIARASGDEREMCARIASAFDEAVRVRLKSAPRAVALLSGGLDSRCVVAQLRAAGAAVDTIGFGPEGTADQVLARQASAALGTRHFELITGPTDFWQRLHEAHASWLAERGTELPDPQARALWTGEGGDRVLAPVNLTEQVIEAMRSGNPNRAASIYMELEHVGLPPRLFRRRVRERVLHLPRLGLVEELGRRKAEDPGRRFHLYVLLNESRRNIKQHFENLDLSRVELIMPFYDSRLIEVVLSYPLDLFVRHRLYLRLLQYLPPGIRQVPWQAYPGSEPCPLPMPQGIRTQWEHFYTPEEERMQAGARLARAAEIASARSLPDWLLSRPVLHAARLLMHFGFTRYDYLFDKACVFLESPPHRDSLQAT